MCFFRAHYFSKSRAPKIQSQTLPLGTLPSVPLRHYPLSLHHHLLFPYWPPTITSSTAKRGKGT